MKKYSTIGKSEKLIKYFIQKCVNNLYISNVESKIVFNTKIECRKKK